MLKKIQKQSEDDVPALIYFRNYTVINSTDLVKSENTFLDSFPCLVPQHMIENCYSRFVPWRWMVPQ